MANVSTWSTTAANNNATPPDGWPEGQAPSTVNDCAREMMASLRSKFEDGEWFNWGHAPTFTGSTTFTTPTNTKSVYPAGRRIRCNDATTLYGQVVDSTYTATTSITVALDSGNLSASLTAVAVANIMPTSNSIPNTIGRKGADIASASSIDLGAATGDFVDVTGTTTITALGTANAGIVKTVRFTGALTLTHNGTSLILPGAVNITTTSGDTANFRSLGSGNWICISYKLASGANTITGIKGADIASASTVDLSTATGDFIDITGTTTITAFGTMAAGIQRTVRFTGALTLTHNGTSLILPGSSNITTANGDVAILRSLGSGNWKCLHYAKQNGKAVVESASSLSAASQSDQETGTSTTVYVSPGTQQYHPSALKAGVRFTSVTTTAVTSSYNVGSLTDNGTGDTTITFTTNFSNGNYVYVTSVKSFDDNPGNNQYFLFGKNATAPTSSALRVLCMKYANSAADVEQQNVIMVGDQ